MADNTVNIEVEVTGDGKVKLREIADEARNLATSGSQAFAQFGSAFQVAEGFIAGSVIIGAFNVAKDAVLGFAKAMFVDGVKAAINEEEAMNRLNVSLAAAGKFSKSTSEEFGNFAEGLERTTRFQKDAILTSAAFIESLGRLDKEGLKNATQATLDLAAATGKDLNEAATIVGKAAAGQTTALQRLGITVDKGATSAETFANALQAINNRFGGAAAGSINTYKGSLDLAGKAWEDLTKTFGQAVVQNQAVVDVFKAISVQLFAFGEVVKENQGALKQLIAQGIIILIETMKVGIQVVDVFVTGFQNMYNTIKAIFFGLGAVVAGALSLVSDSQKAVFEDFKKTASDAANSAATNFVGNGVLGQIVGGLDHVGDAATAAYAKMLAGVDSVTPELKNSTAAIVEQNNELQKLKDAAEKAAEAIITKGETATQQLLVESATLEENNAQKLLLEETYTEASKSLADQILQAKLEAMAKELEALVTTNENLTALGAQKNAQEIADNQLRIDTLTAQTKTMNDQRAIDFAQEVADLQAKNAALSADDALANANEIAQNDARIQQTKTQEAELSKALTTENRKRYMDDYNTFNNRINAMKNAFGYMEGLSKSNSSVQRGIAKAAAISQAIISTYQAATGAFAAFSFIPFIGPALGFAAAAVIIAAGIANINAIRSTPLAAGITDVPGVGTKDQFPALLAPGERVVPRDSNTDLKAFLKDSGGLSGIMASIDSKISKLSNQIIVQVGDREIVNVIRDSLNSGRSFAT